MTGLDGLDRDKLSGYSICTSPRSGSNFLCQHLSGTGLLGHPLEYFNWGGRRYFDDPDYPKDIAGQVWKILTMGATANGIYGLKLFAHQHDWISGEVNWVDALPNLRFVLLTRRDLLGQAISWARALQTGQYRSSQPMAQKPIFDAGLIQSQLNALARERARWEMFFARTGIEPLRFEYETMIEDPRHAVSQVAELMGLKPPSRLDPGNVTVELQRDASNLEWADRFRAERGDPNILDLI
ncbi:Stf0 family sulfotransferase [Mesorhizobium sp. M0217]|uniref:Stf0 family sulfotransferase n=1 Tax=unclassified Mesorhizobium TaxID=325217 RepID=UPI0033398C13